MKETKLQIRARLLSAILELQKPANKTPQALEDIIDSLKDIEDRVAVLEILVKELKKEIDDEKGSIIFCLLHELSEKDKVEEALLKELASPVLSDSIKSNIINVLRGYGNHLNYDDYLQYLDNPEEIIDADTSKLLANAIINPEAQIDFLDFINALPSKEAKMLLESLHNDYDGDNLANILSPVILSKPYSEIAFEAMKAIGESKSQLALHTLNEILDTVNDLQVKAQAQKSISLLKLSGIKEDKTKEFYSDLLSQSPVHKCFANIPDGHGNVGIIFSREKEGLIQMFAVVVNDIDGIVDCFGFNEISESELERITSKFFANDEIIEISPQFCKYLLVNAENTTRLMYDEMPYEYVCWRTIINDIDYEEFDLTKDANKIGLNEFLLKQVYNKGYFEKWFFDERDTYSQYLSQLNDTEELFSTALPIEAIFNQDILKTLNNRLLLMSYMLRLEGNNIEADIIYSLSFDSEIKKKFLEDILKKSIYEYYLNQKEKYYSATHAASIFTRKKEEERQKIDIDTVEKTLKKIEENWAND